MVNGPVEKTPDPVQKDATKTLRGRDSAIMLVRPISIFLFVRGSHLQSDTHSFIVRVWHEAVNSKGRATTWRGSIDHVGSGQCLYFDDLDGVVRFIQEQARLNIKRSSHKWRSLLACIKRMIT